MSMGIPIICNSNIGDTDRIVQNTRSGLIVRSFTEEDYDLVIQNFHKLLTISKEKIRTTAIEIFALEKGISKYDSVYKSIEPVSE